jgi:hypothetical protein
MKTLAFYATYFGFPQKCSITKKGNIVKVHMRAIIKPLVSHNVIVKKIS